MKIRRSRTGLTFSVIYGAMAIPLLIYAFGIEGDYKGAYVFKQVAVAPALLAMDAIIPPHLVEWPGFLNNVPVFFLLSFAMVYSVGWLVGLLGRFVLSNGYAYMATERVSRPTSPRMRTARHLLATIFFFALD
nr:hypothetical protein NG677_03675 [Methylobacterium sp. OTU13CASTA1]